MMPIASRNTTYLPCSDFPSHLSSVNVHARILKYAFRDFKLTHYPDVGLRSANPTYLLIIIASSFTPFRTIHAEVAKLADALDSGSSAPWGVRVQIPPSAPTSLFLRSP